MDRKKILIVDDNQEFLETIRDFLEKEGYEARTLSDPFRTEEYMDEFAPDLLVLDIFMPGRSGFNIIEDFSEKGVYGDIPKIFLTGLDSDIERMTAKGIGVSRYLVKPFQPDELSRTIKDILGLQ